MRKASTRSTGCPDTILLRAVVLVGICGYATTAIKLAGSSHTGTSPPLALDLLYRGEVAPPHLARGGLVEGSRGQGGWERVVAAIEAQAEVLEARADELRLSIQQETSVGLMLRQEADIFKVSELEAAGPAALSGNIQVDDHVVAIDRTPVRGLALFEATALLRGAPSSELVLTLSRRTGSSEDVVLHRSPDTKLPRTRFNAEDRLRLSAGSLTASTGQWGVGVSLGEGLIVESVAANSSAAAAGVRKGDTLLSVDSMRVTGGAPAKVAALLTSRHYGASLHLLLTRPLSPENAGQGVVGHCVEGGSLVPALLSVIVSCSEPALTPRGADEKSSGEGGSLKFTSTKQTIKAVKGLFKGLFS